MLAQTTIYSHSIVAGGLSRTRRCGTAPEIAVLLPFHGCRRLGGDVVDDVGDVLGHFYIRREAPPVI